MGLSEIQRLMDRCAGGVEIRIDGHLEDATPIAEYLQMFVGDGGLPCPPDVMAEIIQRNRVVWISAHPRTPNAHCDAMHWNIDEAIQAVHEELDREPR